MVSQTTGSENRVGLVPKKIVILILRYCVRRLSCSGFQTSRRFPSQCAMILTLPDDLLSLVSDLSEDPALSFACGRLWWLLGLRHATFRLAGSKVEENLRGLCIRAPSGVPCIFPLAIFLPPTIFLYYLHYCPVLSKVSFLIPLISLVLNEVGWLNKYSCDSFYSGNVIFFPNELYPDR